MVQGLIAGFTGEVEAGVFFRLMAEGRFECCGTMLVQVPVQLRRLGEGELLIGDAPTLALMDGEVGPVRWMA
jgi:hypothetical protein